ncbi:hypothetical protein SRABI82_04964 [Priestia megaterium]|nr:hypothetical protein SRABI82_04964 [Priestia megaterium]
MFFQYVKRVHVIYNRDNTNQMVRNEFKKLETRYGCKFTDTRTKLIHDRVWMGGRRTARLVGRSFNNA